jgi:predicted Zn-dependent protease
MGYMLVKITSIAAGDPGVGAGVDIAFQQIMLGYSREDELLADKLATKYMELAGYDPKSMISFLELIKEIDRKKPLRPFTYLRTHPYIPDRIAQIKRTIGMPLDFEDVVNIDQEY